MGNDLRHKRAKELAEYYERKEDKLQCGFCKKKFDIDAPVSVIIDHLIQKHRKRTLAEFCFMRAFIKVHSVDAK